MFVQNRDFTPLIRVLLADDHTLVAGAIREMLSAHVDCVGVVSNGEELVAETRRLRPDVVVTDLAMPGMNGLEAIRAIRRESLETSAIILSMHSDPFLVAEAIRTGASGYVVKHSGTAELLAAIQEVAAGGTYITPLIASDVVAELMNHESRCKPAFKFTERKRQILQLSAQGLSMKQIAAALNISRRTAESHKYQLMRMLGVRNTAELVRYAEMLGFAPLHSPVQPQQRAHS